MFQRGVSPVRLSQLDVRPAVEAAQMVAAAKANLNSSVNQSILNFAQKQQKKKQDKIGIKAIQNMYGLDETTAKAVYSDEIVRDAFNQKQKSDANLIRKQREQLQLEILQDEQKRVQKQRDILEKAIIPNIDTSGMVDKEGVKRTFVQLGGTDKSVLGLFDTPGEIKIDDKGIITQDGVFKGQVPQSALGKEPTQEEKEKTKLDLEKSRAEIEKLRAQIAKIESEMPTTEFDPEKLEGIDKEAYDYAIANPGTPESEEILIRLGAK